MLQQDLEAILAKHGVPSPAKPAQQAQATQVHTAPQDDPNLDAILSKHGLIPKAQFPRISIPKKLPELTATPTAPPEEEPEQRSFSEVVQASKPRGHGLDVLSPPPAPWQGVPTKGENRAAQQAYAAKLAKGRKAYEEHPTAGRAFETAAPFFEALGIPEENLVDLTMTSKESKEGKRPRSDYYKKAGRTALAMLPFVPPPDVEDRPGQKEAVESRQLAGGELANRDPWTRQLPQMASGLSGLVTSLATTGGPIKKVGEQLAKKTAAPLLKTALGGTARSTGSIPAAVNLGLYSAMPEIEKGSEMSPFKAAGDFAEGVILEGILRGTGVGVRGLAQKAVKTGVVPPKLAETLARHTTPVAQASALAAIYAPDGEKLRHATLSSALFWTAHQVPRLRGVIPGFSETKLKAKPKTLVEMQETISPQEMAAAAKTVPGPGFGQYKKPIGPTNALSLDLRPQAFPDQYKKPIGPSQKPKGWDQYEKPIGPKVKLSDETDPAVHGARVLMGDKPYLRDLSERIRGAFRGGVLSPQDRQLMKEAPKVHGSWVKAMVARPFARSFGEYRGAAIQKILPESWMVELFGRKLLDEQYHGLVAQGREPQTWLKMTPTDRALYNKFRPQFFAEAERFHQETLAQLDQYSPPGKGGIRGRRVTPNDLYTRLPALSGIEKSRLKNLDKIFTREKRATVLVSQDLATEARKGNQGSGAYRLSKRHVVSKAGSARQATGQSAGYSIDYSDMIHDMALDRLKVTTRLDLMNELQKNAIRLDPRTKKAPLTTKFAGRDERVVAVDMNRFPNWAETSRPLDEMGEVIKSPVRGKPGDTTIYLPETLARHWLKYLNPPKEGLSDDAGFRFYQKTVVNPSTRLVLATGGEVVGHAFGLLGGLAQVPGIGRNPFMRTLAYGGITRFATVMDEVFNVMDSSFEKDFLSGLRHAGIRSAHFAEYGGGFEEKIPVLGAAKDWMFGLPGPGGGGFEARTRVAYYRAVKRGDPALSDAKAWHIVNNALGTYSTEMAPVVAKFLQKLGIDVFARAGVALIKGGIRSTAGIGPTRSVHGTRKAFSKELLFGGLPATIASMVLLQKLLDSDGGLTKAGEEKKYRWIWEIPDLPLGYMRVGGQDWPVMRFMANNVQRALNHTGIKGIADAALDGEKKMQPLVMGLLRGLGNSVFGRASPAVRIGFASATGKAPWLTKGGDFLPLEQQSMEDPLAERAKAVGKVALPQWQEASHINEREDAGAGDWFAAFWGISPRRKVVDEREAVGAPSRAEYGKLYDVVRDANYHTRDIKDISKRMDEVKKYLKGRVPEELESAAYRIAITQIRKRFSSVERSFRRVQNENQDE